MAAGGDGAALRELAREFGVSHLALANKERAAEHQLPGGIEAVSQLAIREEVDIVVVAVAGVIGLAPTLAAIDAGKAIALASKEVLVAAGEVVMPRVRERGVTMTPIDSEHSAIFQCLQGYRPDQVKRLLITASGGPFRGWSREQLAGVTVEQALKHPTWTMGGKITIDSATLMNKGLETIEARWLFDIELDRVEVVVHPQSIVHSFVEFHDGSMLAQMGWPNMRLPIQYALLYPERVESGLPPYDPVATPQLTFEAPDLAAFPCLALAREAGRIGGTMPCVMNAANEEAVGLFLAGGCGFMEIPQAIERAMERHTPEAPTLENLLLADAWARATVRDLHGSTIS